MSDLIDSIIEAVLERSTVTGVCSCCADGDVYAELDHRAYGKETKSDYDKCREAIEKILKEK